MPLSCFKSELKNHYRGHKMSLWLNLIPQLHQPGLEELSMRHHHFQEEGAQYYDGSVRPQTLQRPVLVTAAPSTTTTSTTTEAPATSTLLSVLEGSSTECPPNSTQGPAARPATNSNSLLRKLASSHYQSYTTALTVTIAVGCFLLLLNILIFAGIYHQRDRREGRKRKSKKEDLGEGNSCSSSSEIEGKQALAESIVQQHMVELQEFKCSPPSGSRGMNCTTVYPPGYMQEDTILSPSIPEPPPPPKAQAPAATATVAANQAGILRAPTPQTPNTMKKRVQIQEISV
ncbi:hypothetical protein GE061_010225 [Apolygus lucorum]|uniref:Neuroligin n=1 Tax=Apolygus lucorum TaxID=248454 RepID=A0A6A4KE67_APOLU|nr:hypothetical protein GE061_010225 [Apolygus lucorum]